MRLVQFVVDCPWPPLSGSDFRNTLLASHNDSAAYLCLGLTAPYREQYTSPVKYHQLQCFADSNPWRSFDPKQPTSIRFPPSAFSEVEHLLDTFQPTVAVVEGVALGAILTQLQAWKVPTVLNMHNIESTLFEERMQGRPWYKKLLPSSYDRRWRQTVRETDRELSYLADQTWVCSDVDAASLSSLGGASAHIIPNPIPDESLSDIPIFTDRYRNQRPLFIGHLSFFPNVAAVMEIGKVLVPLLAQRRIACQPIVAGRAPSRAIRKLAARGSIHLITNPASCKSLLADSGYTLLPIRHGSGTRLKVLEALAAGIVVIATLKAVEGLGLIDGVHYCHAESIDEMGNRLSEFTAQPELAEQLAKRGRQFVIENYSRTTIHAKIAKALSIIGYTDKTLAQ